MDFTVGWMVDVGLTGRCGGAFRTVTLRAGGAFREIAVHSGGWRAIAAQFPGVRGSRVPGPGGLQLFDAPSNLFRRNAPKTHDLLGAAVARLDRHLPTLEPEGSGQQGADGLIRLASFRRRAHTQLEAITQHAADLVPR